MPSAMSLSDTRCKCPQSKTNYAKLPRELLSLLSPRQVYKKVRSSSIERVEETLCLPLFKTLGRSREAHLIRGLWFRPRRTPTRSIKIGQNPTWCADRWLRALSVVKSSSQVDIQTILQQERMQFMKKSSKTTIKEQQGSKVLTARSSSAPSEIFPSTSFLSRLWKLRKEQ